MHTYGKARAFVRVASPPSSIPLRHHEHTHERIQRGKGDKKAKRGLDAWLSSSSESEGGGDDENEEAVGEAARAAARQEEDEWQSKPFPTTKCVGVALGAAYLPVCAWYLHGVYHLVLFLFKRGFFAQVRPAHGLSAATLPLCHRRGAPARH